MTLRRTRPGRRSCPIFGEVHRKIRKEAAELRSRALGVACVNQAPESRQLYDAALEWLALHPEVHAFPYLGETYQIRRSSIGRLVICWHGEALFVGPFGDA